MQANGVGADQVTQVRGFADQRLRKADAPLDPANRRISIIVQYILKNEDDEKPVAASAEGGEEKEKSEAKPAGAQEKPESEKPSAGEKPSAAK
jgi:chemotaxis protein MotB